jgi:hypothetical protein
MNLSEKTYIIIGAAALLSVVFWGWLVVVPAWTSYSRLWDRFLAMVLSAYVLAAFVLAGVCVGGVVLWYYDRL